MRLAGAAYTLSPMRIAFFGGRACYAHSRGGEGVAPEGAVPRWYRPPTFESSFLFLRVARPTDSRLRTRPRRSEGRRILGCPLLSATGHGTVRAQSCGSGPRPAGASARVGPARGASGHQAGLPLGTHSETSPVVLFAHPFSIPPYDVRVLLMYTPVPVADPVPGEVQDDQSHTPEPTAIDGEEVVERIPGHAKKEEAAGGVQLGPGVPEKREIVDSVVEARGHIW